jgi:hypothetical protein
MQQDHFHWAGWAQILAFSQLSAEKLEGLHFQCLLVMTFCSETLGWDRGEAITLGWWAKQRSESHDR